MLRPAISPPSRRALNEIANFAVEDFVESTIQRYRQRLVDTPRHSPPAQPRHDASPFDQVSTIPSSRLTRGRDTRFDEGLRHSPESFPLIANDRRPSSSGNQNLVVEGSNTTEDATNTFTTMAAVAPSQGLQLRPTVSPSEATLATLERFQYILCVGALLLGVIALTKWRFLAKRRSPQ